MSSGPAKGPLLFDIAILDPRERIQGFINRYLLDDTYAGHEATLMRAIRVTSASQSSAEGEDDEAKATFELEVVPGLCNPMNMMHGGAMALLADMTTTMTAAPIARHAWREFGGVSRTLGVTYLRPTYLGTTVAVHCILRSVSSRLSVIQFIARDKASGKLLALAEHGKSAIGTHIHPKKASRL